MAKMYPNTFPEDAKSSGERKVFNYLKENAPSDWYVLHSFRLPKHKTVVFGEADFVVIAPKYGIFILEIKSGGVGFDGSDWIFVDREHKQTRKKRGPFQQAHDAMFEIEKILVDRLGEGYRRTNIIYGYGVIFTDETSFPQSAITEDEVWRLCQKTANNDYCKFVKKLYQNFVVELKQLGKPIPAELSEEYAISAAKSLRPIVDCVIPLHSFSQSTEADILSLTEEQYDCLDDIEINPRMVVTGGAGTGKTLIAVEEAKRSISDDTAVALFCYNKNLADYIKASLSDQRITVYSIHAFMIKICSFSSADLYYSSEFFEQELPGLACLAAKDNGICFDKIIVDECQDLCTDEYLKFFDTILKKGLLDGQFTFYGDFARQAIYNKGSSLETLRNYTYFAQKRLSINCRNTIYIGNELINLTGYSDSHYKLKIKGEPVDYLVWASIEDEIRHLNNIIRDLNSAGFKPSSIMVISPKKRVSSVLNFADPNKYIVGDYGEDSDSYLAMFSTIQAFKGLESEVIILIDIDNYTDNQLMYIALSRARSKLFVLESESASKQRKKITIKR